MSSAESKVRTFHKTNLFEDAVNATVRRNGLDLEACLKIASTERERLLIASTVIATLFGIEDVASKSAYEQISGWVYSPQVVSLLQGYVPGFTIFADPVKMIARAYHIKEE